MKILFASNHTYIPQRAGGSESSTHDLAIALSELGHEVAVIARLEHRRGATWVRNRLLSRALRQSFPADTIRPYRIFRGYGDPDILSGLEEVTQRFLPDVVLVQAGRPVPIAEKCVRLALPTVLYVRDVEFENHGGPFFRNPLLSYVANSHFTSAMLRERFGICAQVVPPLVRREAYATQTHRRTVLFVNPVAAKGLDIVCQLAAAAPDIPFVFVEGWPLSDEEKGKLLGRLAPLRNVRLSPSTTDMRKYYSDARVVIVPSQLQEAWGRVATEAQFSGIPVIATRIGGLPESVGTGGLLIPADASIDQWLGALRALWDDLAFYQRMSDAATRYAARPEISSDYICHDLLRAIHDAMERVLPTRR